MSKEISKKLMCLIMRNGIQIWFDEDQARQIKQLLANSKESKFVEFKDEVFNTADVSGIFKAKNMGDFNRVKRGQWQDKYGGWHDKFDKVSEEDLELKYIIDSWDKKYPKNKT